MSDGDRQKKWWGPLLGLLGLLVAVFAVLVDIPGAVNDWRQAADHGRGEPARCVPGDRRACMCGPDQGEATCTDDGFRFGSCVCPEELSSDAPPAPQHSTSCVPGEPRACFCASGAVGFLYCTADGSSFGRCSCPTPSSASPPTVAHVPRGRAPGARQAHLASVAPSAPVPSTAAVPPGPAATNPMPPRPAAPATTEADARPALTRPPADQVLANVQSSSPRTRRAQLTSAEQLAEALMIEERGARISRRVASMLDRARREGDILRVTCLGDKLTQINAHLRTVQSRRESLQEAADTGDHGRRNHEYTVITVLNQQFRSLEQEASSCIGQDVFEGR